MTHLATPLGETAPVRSGAILAGQGFFDQNAPHWAHLGGGARIEASTVSPILVARPFAAPFRIMPFHSTGVADARR